MFYIMRDPEPYNERADSSAKLTLDLKSDMFEIPITDLKSQINRFLYTGWQIRWNKNIDKLLFLSNPLFKSGNQALEN